MGQEVKAQKAKGAPFRRDNKFYFTFIDKDNVEWEWTFLQSEETDIWWVQISPMHPDVEEYELLPVYEYQVPQELVDLIRRKI